MLAAAQVRHAIAARLTGLPLTGARVFTDRTWPLAEKDLPAWKVVTPDEDIEPMTVHKPMLQKHAQQVEVQGYARAVTGLDDALDALASEALTALFNEPGTPDALSAIAGKLQLSARRIERAMTKEGEASVGMTQITVRAEFSTLSTAPDTLI